ncbi:hypothetical protein PFICI_09349 [Pestalotiopsis fici W106-1]|uniref:Uncharacterized protein n=1 Tax=Pestalotiopsis fici (strain W106-1 / CGMCC3.15140) TaxID=1229662 RepID=W3X2W8_PESFW|nr:uncharacterized protein PFICI_09349 [Pestalotiopsis fici W106-1]ETS79496.1 hypothetical protein PFICI_09349 [Pestalotiopsis fici W106-1]
MDEFGWTAEDDVAMHEVGDSLDVGMEPGATVMWFGTHEGVRMDELTEEYRRHLEHGSYWDRTPNLLRFRNLHTRYLDWLDQERSPLSAPIWFGKYRGHELRILYTRPRRWRWLMDNCGKWRRALLDMIRRYELWRELHDPDWQYRRRRRRQTHGRMIVNKVGERLLPRDDGPASDDDDSYATDSSFIVRDSDMGTDQDGESSQDEDDPFEPSSDAESDVILDGDFDVQQQASMVVGTMESEGETTPRTAAKRDERRRPLTLFGDSDKDSDNEFPSVAAMFRTPQRPRAPRVRVADESHVHTPTQTQRIITISSSSESHAGSIVEDDDEDDKDEELRPHFSQATNRLFDVEAKGGREGRIGTRVRTSPRKYISLEISSSDDDNTARNTPRTSVRSSRSIPRLPPPQEDSMSSSSDELVPSPTRRITFMDRSKISPIRRKHSDVTLTPRRQPVRNSPRRNAASPRKQSPRKQSPPKESISLITSEEEEEKPVQTPLKRRHSRISVSQTNTNRRDLSPYDSDDLPIYPKGFGRKTAAPANSMDSPASLDSDDKPLRPRSSPIKHTPTKVGDIICIDSDDEPVRPPPSRRKRSQAQEMHTESDDEPISPRKPNHGGYR